MGPAGCRTFLTDQVAALALPVKGILNVDQVPFGDKFVTGLSFLHRQACPPEVAAAPVVMVALLASDPGFGVAPVAEQDRRFSPCGF